MDTAPHPPRAGGSLTFREAAEADVPALYELIQAAYRDGAGGWTTEAALIGGGRIGAPQLREIIGAEGELLIVAEREGAVVGCCRLEHRGATALFGLFAVHPRLQAGGLGRRILAEAERRARETWGVRAVHMTVISLRDELIAWYERRGYRRTGELTPFPYEEETASEPFRDDLTFELLVKEVR
ncbi:GNAT family N-acetyltransferase [Streptomyces sp. NPDC001985]|uniref:GNAT family N-acetyltransferase n=1 Tax=Streptomyces sp. NPDC001985 TaxID=3154406 RepID=UPI00332ED26E